ncbi:unnamed protein product [Auanema sp. JU1783]|nr:unnamed protein product [Auanema sp. JU1783]
MHFGSLPTLLLLLTLYGVQTLRCFDAKGKEDICRFNPWIWFRATCFTKYRDDESRTGKGTNAGSVESISWSGCLYLPRVLSKGRFKTDSLFIKAKVCLCYQDLCNNSTLSSDPNSQSIATSDRC